MDEVIEFISYMYFYLEIFVIGFFMGFGFFMLYFGEIGVFIKLNVVVCILFCYDVEVFFKFNIIFELYNWFWMLKFKFVLC